jgi:hypothetical protein
MVQQKSVQQKSVQQKTFWRLLPQRRMPSEYEIVTSKLL